MKSTVKTTALEQDAISLPIETHPFDPFLPDNTRILILGTFPPKENRWSMKFYYPNKINDFWRIMGLVFFDNRDRFINELDKTFRLDDIRAFLTERGIALCDTGFKVRRLQDNASDKFLEIVEPVNLEELMGLIPTCKNLATTGEKAAGVISDLTGISAPKVGESITGVTPWGKELKIFRMPSTSRAYPLSLEKKAEQYEAMFREVGLL
ncbi:MAG: uracil-DNA glycosylase family protein [Bacteroides sp.]|nr:uracil-DNA glycosylase family protein [Bacteroides sp.]